MDEDLALQEQCQARLGEQLSGKWTLEALIGVGGMAAVYLGRHRNGATAAIKLLHLEFAGHAELRARFQREAYIANKVDHPGAVKVLDDDVTAKGEPYLVMELLKGTSVENLAVQSGGRLSLAQTLGLVEQALVVLDRAHAAGIVHRDLKPDNLFVTDQGTLKVLDFGIARLREGADNNKRTRTGLLMGTPAFMAPEQALGRWSEVDARTDLWAVGAIMFSLLTGRAVHEAATANEMIVLSATRPAPSLGRFVSGPLGLVKLVDRALGFDRSRRFADAGEMRAELVKLMTELGIPVGGAGSTPTERLVPPAEARGGANGGCEPARPAPGGVVAAAQPAVAFAATEPGVAVPRGQKAVRLSNGGTDYDTSSVTAEDMQAMQQLFTLLERSLVSCVQYGALHPEALRRQERLFGHVASALMHTDSALVWNVTPYSFVAKDQTLWEPKSPFDRIPYQLFSDGIRLLGFLPGLTQAEFSELLRILTLDRTLEMAPEDDFVTLFWDSCFEHIVHRALDTFVEGDQEARARFVRQVAGVEKLARFDTSMQLEDCWQAHHGRGGKASAEAKRERLLRMLSAPRGADTEAVAQAAALRDRQQKEQYPVHADVVLRPEPAVLQALGARMRLDTGVLGERFVYAAAVGYGQAARLGTPGSVSGPLSTAIDALAEKQPLMAIEMIGALCRQVEQGLSGPQGKALGAALIAEVVSRRTMERLLEGAREDQQHGGLYGQGLRTVLSHIDDQHVSVVLKALATFSEGELTDALMAYLGRVARGHEKELGDMFLTAELELGLALVRVLATLETKEARAAIMVGCSSPHPVVRIEALGYVEGVSSERLRLELRSLLEDRETGVRVAALRSMETYGIRVAGPFLVMRIRSPVFNKLPSEERRAALTTVAKLAPRRAEDICVEILGDSRMLSSDAHEQSRELAAELLGELASTRETVALLEEEAAKRWKTSDRVRAAAGRALERVRQRFGGTNQAWPS